MRPAASALAALAQSRAAVVPSTAAAVVTRPHLAGGALDLSSLSVELAIAARPQPSKGKRRRAPPEVLAALVSHADVQAYRLDKAAEWLADELPPASVLHLLGGERALLQVPDPAEH